MRRLLEYGFVILLLAGVCADECAAKRKDQNPPPDPAFVAIQNISVLPLVDARAGEKKTRVDLEKLQASIVRALTKQSHYHADAASTSGEAGKLEVEDVESGAPAYIKKLGASNERWVMVVFLEDTASKGWNTRDWGGTSNAQLAGYLFDKGNGSLVWKGRGVGQAGAAGLAGMVGMGSIRSEALSKAVTNLLAGLPNHPKSGK
jgi:hypothetical protein